MLADQVALVLASWALLAAASRLAATIAGTLIERILVAVVVAAGFLVCYTLLLGLAGLSGSVVCLAAGPVLAWAAVRALVAAPATSVSAEVITRFLASPRRVRVAALALIGLAAGAAVEVAREPAFGIDMLAYHLADVVGWLHSGHAGSVQTLTYDFPVGYYPITNEVLLTWVLGVSRSFAPLAPWSAGVAAITLLALWQLLATLRVPQAARWLAVVALGLLPVFTVGINATGPGTDLIAVMWLTCSVALSAAAVTRPALLGPALIAAGLGLGTKTTVAPLALAGLAAGAWAARSRLAPARGWLLAGSAAGLLVGTPWYVRDALSHGWPLWPFTSGPTGDPLPHTMRLFDVSFLSRPVATVSAKAHLYLEWIAGGLALMAGTAVALLASRSRATRLVALLALAALLSWGLAPFTGLSRNPLLGNLALTTVRYLLAPLAACAVALALAAREQSPVARRLGLGALGVAAAGSAVALVSLGSPVAPSAGYLAAGAAAGALVGALATIARGSPSAARLAPPAVALAAVAALALSAPGWLYREARYRDVNAGVLSFMLSRPRFVSGSQPVAFAPVVLATLAGPRLRHDLSLIPANEPCARVRARLARGWVVVRPTEVAPGITTSFDAPFCLRRDHPVYDDGFTVVYASQR